MIMLEELDKLMADRKLAALLVYGDSTFANPELYYVVGVNLPRGGIYLKKRRTPPVLVVSNIDSGNASEGFVKDVRTYSKYGYETLLAKYGREQAGSLLFHRILKYHKVSGKVAVHGRNDAGSVLDLSNRLRRLRHRIVSEKPNILDSARETKSSLEIDRIRDVGLKTQRALGKIIEFLKSCERSEDYLMYEKKKLTVGTVKALARRLLSEENLVSPEDLIMAVGPKSADPHYSGEDHDLVVPDQPIVLDFFPQEIGGYWYDMTRTFVVGKATQEIRRMYESVSEAQQVAFDLIKEQCRAETLMNAVCDHFSGDGFKTIRDLTKGDKESEKMGFVHSLGHGVGLTIGENPYLSLHSNDILKPGNVFTVEPGLYDQRFGGVRIEDVIALTESGIVNLTSYEKILEIRL